MLTRDARPRAPGAKELITLGKVAEQARELHGFLTDARRTGDIGVSLPEEMSVREAVDLDHGLRRAVGRSLDLIVVDGC